MSGIGWSCDKLLGECKRGQYLVLTTSAHCTGHAQERLLDSADLEELRTMILGERRNSETDRRHQEGELKQPRIALCERSDSVMVQQCVPTAQHYDRPVDLANAHRSRYNVVKTSGSDR